MNQLHSQGRRLLEDPLAYPGLPVHKNGMVVIRLWLYPSFTPEISWTVIKRGDQYFLRRITFDHRKPVMTPETYGAEAPIDATLVASLSADLSKQNFPAFAERAGVGLDGCTYGIETESNMARTCIEWWERPPAGWEDLVEWHARVRKVFDSGLPEYSAEDAHVA